MRAPLAPLALAVAALLAGCSGSDPSAPSPAGEASLPDGQTTAAPVAQALPWTAELMPVAFDGNLGTRAVACVFPAATCHAQEVAAGVSDLLLERPGANLTGLDLTLTWTAQTPATATLVFGAMVMGTCETCNSTAFPEARGTSPLQVTVSGADIPLSEDYVVHLYVYNPQGLVHDPNVPAFAFASVDQAFHLEGAVSLRVPPAAGAASAAA